MNRQTPEQRLAEAGLALPPPPKPSANYVGCRRIGQLLFVAGHGPKHEDGSYVCGRINGPEDVERGYAAARLAALNMLATLKSELGDLDQVAGVLKVLGMVNADPDFKAHPKVIDGFSDILTQAFGEGAAHARSAVGMGSLPHGMSVEVEAIFHLKP
ncbi:RidA family protein [Ralstonia holmesii]|uniref:Endoribonuclease L-PSP/chorismate mutase-like domain-containing protein n=1 Tax=Ralstonia holmesii TaxID=3058602 RepID=A0ABC8QEB8_9RALS|nr:RidA family protein [Ralstonia sp. LMG 32967]CAJ0796763.1 hypothetical protein LMG18096_03306 [Ralstonia sp. LMG 32967]CAJ0805825.1 hypothetical protein LMG18093_00076 [Ralstonia sp. LMG 32967]